MNMRRARAFPLIIAVVANLAIMMSETTDAGRSDPYPSGKRGYDISWPQCDRFPAAPFDFGVVGVTGGRAFTHNPCLAAEFTWAGPAKLPATLYTNLQAPVGATGPRYSRNGPAGRCKKKDHPCKFYNYGANAAKHALDYATSQGVRADFWWLDVELTNSWSKNVELNAETVRGAVEFLRANGIAAGIYSTAYQWGTVTGDYAPGLPVWVAGAPGAGSVRGYCRDTHAFAGGRVALVQYPRNGFDGLYSC